MSLIKLLETAIDNTKFKPSEFYPDDLKYIKRNYEHIRVDTASIVDFTLKGWFDSFVIGTVSRESFLERRIINRRIKEPLEEILKDAEYVTYGKYDFSGFHRPTYFYKFDGEDLFHTTIKEFYLNKKWNESTFNDLSDDDIKYFIGFNNGSPNFYKID